VTDSRRRTSAVTDRLGDIREYEYNADGKITKATSARSTNEFTYDARRTPHPEGCPGQRHDLRPRRQGELLSEKDALGTSSHTLQHVGPSVSLTDGAGASNSFAYDAKGTSPDEG